MAAERKPKKMRLVGKKPATDRLLDQLLSANKVTEVTDVIGELSEARQVVWVPVGDNDNNLATINLGSDPAAGLIERITNAVDAVLDQKWHEQGEPAHLLSPRDAVEEWYGVPNGRLSNLKDVEKKDVAEMADNVTVTFRDSERADRPTVDIRDYGTGLLAEDFAKTILSIKGNRKLRKLYLAGAFGQGGLSALAYSHYTVIVSRGHGLSLRDIPPVAVTIVRFNPGNVRVDKHGMYEYAIDHATGQPFTFDVPARDFAPGTLVRHVSMEFSKYKNILTAPTGSPWWLVHNYLFDPILPFRIEEQRDNNVKGSRRMVTGNHRLLTVGKNTEYTRNATLTFRDGSVTISWWVLDAEGEQARNRITQYAQVSKPIIITYNGQKQGDLPNTVIKVDLRLPYLDRYIIVHVDCDQLDHESRRQLFPTTRENIRDSAIGDDLRRLVVETLEADPELKRLDRERKQRYTRQVDSQSVENIRRRLAARVRSVVLAGAGGTSPRTQPPEGTAEPHVLPPIPVQSPPTLLEVTSPNPRRLYAGKSFTLRFRTDADPNLFANPDTFIAVIDPPSFGQYSGTTNVREGYGTAHFRATEELDLGTVAQITLEVRPRRATSLRATAVLEVVALPEAASGGEGKVPTPNINPQWVTERDLFWKDNNWTDKSVAKVIQEAEGVDIFVSADNRRLNQLIVRAQRKDLATVESVKAFYLEHLSYHTLLAALDHDRAIARGPEQGTSEPVAAEMEHESELQRACETVCGIMEEMFDFLADRSDSYEEEVKAASEIAADEEAVVE